MADVKPARTPAWQPIESALRDGTELLASALGEVFIVRWIDFPPGSYCPGGWRIKQLPGRDPVQYLEPTIWAPIPEMK